MTIGERDYWRILGKPRRRSKRIVPLSRTDSQKLAILDGSYERGEIGSERKKKQSFKIKRNAFLRSVHGSTLKTRIREVLGPYAEDAITLSANLPDEDCVRHILRQVKRAIPEQEFGRRWSYFLSCAGELGRRYDYRFIDVQERLGPQHKQLAQELLDVVSKCPEAWWARMFRGVCEARKPVRYVRTVIRNTKKDLRRRA